MKKSLDLIKAKVSLTDPKLHIIDSVDFTHSLLANQGICSRSQGKDFFLSLFFITRPCRTFVGINFPHLPATLGKQEPFYETILNVSVFMVLLKRGKRKIANLVEIVQHFRILNKVCFDDENTDSSCLTWITVFKWEEMSIKIIIRLSENVPSF